MADNASPDVALEKKDILDHFEWQIVTQDILNEYTKLKGYQPITLGDYKDFVFEREHDARMQKLVPRFLSKLAEFKVEPEGASEKEQKEIQKYNEALEIELAEILEDEGTLYRELDIVIKGLQRVTQAMIHSAGQRMTNMCLRAMVATAEEVIGKELPIKDMANYHRGKSGIELR